MAEDGEGGGEEMKMPQAEYKFRKTSHLSANIHANIQIHINYAYICMYVHINIYEIPVVYTHATPTHAA